MFMLRLHVEVDEMVKLAKKYLGGILHKNLFAAFLIYFTFTCIAHTRLVNLNVYSIILVRPYATTLIKFLSALCVTK